MINLSLKEAKFMTSDQLLEVLDCNWQKELKEELNKPYFLEILAFLKTKYESKTPVYPPKQFIFEAFKMCPLEQVKVVILGQDPYHGEGQAHGLSFSVQGSQKLPPSLKNIFKELESDLNLKATKGDLTAWAQQGVLLLNSTLTVEKGSPGSHQKMGWEQFTDQVLKIVSDHEAPKVFILWGMPAYKKIKFIDQERHLVLTSAHPSPLSSYRGFFGSRPFSKANEFLKSKNRSIINWELNS